jgi:hypothetical protein
VLSLIEIQGTNCRRSESCIRDQADCHTAFCKFGPSAAAVVHIIKNIGQKFFDYEWIGSSLIHLSPKCGNFLNTATRLPTMWCF